MYAIQLKAQPLYEKPDRGRSGFPYSAWFGEVHHHFQRTPNYASLAMFHIRQVCGIHRIIGKATLPLTLTYVCKKVVLCLTFMFKTTALQSLSRTLFEGLSKFFVRSRVSKFIGSKSTLILIFMELLQDPKSNFPSLEVHMTKCHSIRHQTPKFPTPQKSYATIFLGLLRTLFWSN